MPDSTRKVCITAVDSPIGFRIAELMLKEGKFSKGFASLTGLALHPSSSKVAELEQLGAKIVEYLPGRECWMVSDFEQTGCDTLCLVPPDDERKFDLTMELIGAAKKAGISNVLLISSAGADQATKEKQPRLREFIELENSVLSAKSDSDVVLGYSPCVIRAGLYFESILKHFTRVYDDDTLALPIGQNHKIAPVALDDVAGLAAHVLVGKGTFGFDDRHHSQMMVVTGPMLCDGEELAEAASKALGKTLEYEAVSEAETKSFIRTCSETEYILEYYSLVREGKTNYIATTAFRDVTGVDPTELDAFYWGNAMNPRPKKKTKH